MARSTATRSKLQYHILRLVSICHDFIIAATCNPTSIDIVDAQHRPHLGLLSGLLCRTHSSPMTEPVVKSASPKNLGVRPTAFMFIDASNGGINAKPDKVVRSFVMKSARNKKPWSTKPRNQASENGITETSLQGLPCQPKSCTKLMQTGGSNPQQQCYNSPIPWDFSVVLSPSSGSDSVASSRNSDMAHGSPVSSYASPRAECENIGFPCDAVQHIGSIYQPSPSTRLTASFNCLAVRLDAYTEGLIHQCTLKYLHACALLLTETVVIEFTTPNLFPIDLYKSSREAATHWVSSCLQSPIGAPFIYAALTTSSRAANHASEIYKWRAVSAVNDLLTNEKYSTDDTTIASVLILLALEESDLAGSGKMGEDLRSSIEGGLQPCLEIAAYRFAYSCSLWAQGNTEQMRLISNIRHSIAQSITTFRRPYAVLDDISGYFGHYATTSSNFYITPSHITRQCQDLGVNRILLEIIHAIVVFVPNLILWYDRSSCLVDSIELQKHASLLMYRLFDWYDRCPGDDRHAMDRSICLALLIFMTHATEPKAVPFGSRLAKVVGKLHVIFQEIPLSAWSNARDVYLWVITMGALGSQDPLSINSSLRVDPIMVFFAQKFALAFETGTMDVTAEAYMIDKLHACLWIPSVFDARLVNLWEIMQSCNLNISDESSTGREGDGHHLVTNDYALGQSTTMRFFANDRAGKKRGTRTIPVLIARYPLRVSPDSNISRPISPSCLTFSQPRRDEVSSLRDTKQHVKSHIRDIDMPDHRPDSSISSGIPSTFWSDHPSRPPHSLLVRQPTRRPSARPAAEFASPPRDMETNAYRRLVEAKDIRDTELC
ncbi:predicted protein [Plenodomus lingam JN3]|uniref:Predicted protein n=1 Tax=Leptosphaeria maculans (strain JN3 / isolate v23.1.3 / race Av1-4-5-6-7-8) TaxID=985895 RepID=E5A8L4_LEPMJ|nr:predicted protein [Plenodomus lingam JN3]CBX99959.1 predicted protein [Plenodomus lingam JN3]